MSSRVPKFSVMEMLCKILRMRLGVLWDLHVSKSLEVLM